MTKTGGMRRGVAAGEGAIAEVAIQGNTNN
jgi:hypothetical protein